MLLVVFVGISQEKWIRNLLRNIHMTKGPNYPTNLKIMLYGILFIGGHSFIKGMVADIENKIIIDNIMDELEQEIKDEIDPNRE